MYSLKKNGRGGGEGEPRIESMVLYNKKQQKTGRMGGWVRVNQELIVFYNLKKWRSRVFEQRIEGIVQLKKMGVGV